MARIVECVANFSEGRDQQVIDQIADTVARVSGIILLDQQKDAAHHRCVISFIGSPAAVEEAAVRATGKAAELIDLRRHQGEHPRLGATDVIPFIPIRDVTLLDCVAIARRTGEQIARQFGIPVYLYEAAAIRPERRNLADIRKGEFELLREEIATNDARIPDFGERKVHPTAGATAVGARESLIAFNVYLDTEDVAIARQIAKAVRSSGGGLPFVKALGFRAPGRKQTQVSMNLVNYRETPMSRAFEAVREQAEQRGVRVASSEVVGLVPQEAVVAAAEHYLQIENFSVDRILEHRILKARQSSQAGKSVDTFVEAVAAGEAALGGGSVAALSVSLAASLAIMVCNLGTGEKGSTGAEKELRNIQDELRQLKDDALRLVDEDSVAFARVRAAYKMEKGAARGHAIQENLRAAIDAPMQTAVIGLKVLQQMVRLCEVGSREGLSDFGAGAAIAAAGVQSAGYAAHANLRDVAGARFREDARRRLELLVAESLEVAAEIETKVKAKLTGAM